MITVARLAPIKHLDLLLLSVALLKQQDGSAPRTLIIGVGPELAALQELAANLSIADDVRFLGWCDEVELWLRKARVFVLASKSEGLSIALLEAMACGLPAIVPSTGDIEDAVHDRISGIVTQLGTVEELASGIRTVLGLSAQEYTNMSREAVLSASEFSVRAKSLQWHDLLKRWRT